MTVGIKKQSVAALFFTAGCVVGPVQACLNDRDSDSLAQEANGLPDVVRVVTGRFERNPPLFYQMRLQRVRAEIASHPNRLNLYDDAGVACDRLGRDTEAIAWIEKKRTKLGSTNGKTAPATVREAWYRYYANVGTFRVHRWIRAGANRKNLGEVSRARDEIAHAIEIKPSAHFNRERYQLAAMNWILDPHLTGEDTFKEAESFGDYLARLNPHPTAAQVKAEAEGLSGLIVLGNAWESVDVTGALANSLDDAKRWNVAYLTGLRYEELRKKGNKSLVPFRQISDEGFGEHQLFRPDEIETKYQALRAEAEGWQKKRTAFMLRRLRTGHHPDTDVHFWDGYKPSTIPPSLDNPSDVINVQKAVEWETNRKRNAAMSRWGDLPPFYVPLGRRTSAVFCLFCAAILAANSMGVW